MPSPLAHATIGYAAYSLVTQPEESLDRQTSHPHFLLTSIALSWLPDIDAVFGLLLRDMRRFHNNITHSIFFGSLVSLLATAFTPRRYGGRNFVHRFAITYLLYTLHLLTDLMSRSQRGLMLLAPFSSRRFRLPIRLFYGVRWNLSFFNRKHLWTLGTELLFVGITVAVVHKLKRSSELV